MYDRYMYGRYMYEAPIVNGFSAFVKIKKTKKHMEDFSGYETQLRHRLFCSAPPDTNSEKSGTFSTLGT